ncbi:MAG: hypothetical protein JWP90_2525 [Mycetocola sp.]|nr:hypothetical protein [Mycetocola sp.]
MRAIDVPPPLTWIGEMLEALVLEDELVLAEEQIGAGEEQPARIEEFHIHFGNRQPGEHDLDTEPRFPRRLGSLIQQGRSKPQFLDASLPGVPGNGFNEPCLTRTWRSPEDEPVARCNEVSEGQPPGQVAPGAFDRGEPTGVPCDDVVRPDVVTVPGHTDDVHGTHVLRYPDVQ